jgi:hypothetical protein
LGLPAKSPDPQHKLKFIRFAVRDGFHGNSNRNYYRQALHISRLRIANIDNRLVLDDFDKSIA